MRRDRAVVDDTAALRRLSAHQAEGRARGEERATDIDVENLTPFSYGNFVDGTRGHVCARIVEKDIEVAPFRFNTRESGVKRVRIGHVTGQDQCIVRIACCFVQNIGPSAHERRAPAPVQKEACGRAADAASGAGDKDGLGHGISLE